MYAIKDIKKNRFLFKSSNSVFKHVYIENCSIYKYKTAAKKALNSLIDDKNYYINTELYDNIDNLEIVEVTLVEL